MLADMSMKHPDQKLGRVAIVVGGLFILICVVLLILAVTVNSG